jgi:biopolymer transport protein TolQ
MIDSVAVTSDSFGLVATFLRADPVVKAVMLGLAGASLWSWSVIIDRAIKLTSLNREADRFEDEVASGRSLEDIARAAGDQPAHPLPQMLKLALKDWRSRGVTSDAQAGLLLTGLDRSMDSLIAGAARRAENGLGSLAIVATASPFVGLFGTVWGIMNSFRNIAVMKNTNLTVVAPSIAEALFATAIGLAAAIPAYIAYNKFSTDAQRFTSRLEAFADDLAAAVARRLADKGGV